MNQDVLAGIVRHVLTAVGGVLVTKGYTDSATLETAVGAIATLAGVAWSIWHKKKGQPK